jgi:hypothetical protein
MLVLLEHRTMSLPRSAAAENVGSRWKAAVPTWQPVDGFHRNADALVGEI